MVSLGKVTAPKPVNLPSQKKENNQTEVLLSNKPTTSWGGVSNVNDGEENQQDERHSGHMPPPRVIPAQPMPAWGGAGLPEERQKTLELASREQFPTLGSNTQEEKRQEPNGQSYNQRDERPRGQYWDQDDRRVYPDSRDHHDRRYGNYYYNEEDEQTLSPRDRRISYGYRRRPHPRDYHHYDDYSPEDYDDHGEERQRFNYEDREYYPERYDNGDRYEQRPGRYERPSYRGGYGGGHDRRFGPRGMNGGMYSPRRGGYGGFRDDYYGYGGRGGHGRRRDDIRRGERFYDEEEEQDLDHVEASAGKAPPPPPPPRIPPPPPPPGTSDIVDQEAVEVAEALLPKEEDENHTTAEPEHHEQTKEGEVPKDEAGKSTESNSKTKRNPVKILKREPESLNLEIDLGTQVSRPASRTGEFASDEKQGAFSVGPDAIPPSLQGLSLHPITFGDEPAMQAAEQIGSETVSSFENLEHPPGLFTAMEHNPQQPLMTFGTDTDGEHRTEEISLLLNGFDAAFEKTDDKSGAQPLQFGDILLPSTIDGCVEVDSNSQNQSGGNQHRRESYKSRGRGRGRGYRGRGRGAHHAAKSNGNPIPPPPPPPTSKKPETGGQKQAGPKQGKPKKKKAAKDSSVAPPGLVQNGAKSASTTGEKKKGGPKKPYKKKPTASPSPAGEKASQGKEL